MARRSKQSRLYERILKQIQGLDDDSLMALSALSRQLVIARGQAKAKLLNLKTPVEIKKEESIEDKIKRGEIYYKGGSNEEQPKG